MRRMKNKTLAAWLALLGGPLGLHRFYLFGWGNWLGWLHIIPTVVGLYGIARVRQHGLDDPLSWVLIPFLGFSLALTSLYAIVYGLMTREKWNALFNPKQAELAEPGGTNWFTIGAVVLGLVVGAIALTSALAFSFQRYFEYQVDEARKISQ